MKRILSILLIAQLFLLSGFTHADENNESKVIAIVNDQKITEIDLDNHIKLLQTLTQREIKDRKSALNDLIERELLYQEAIKKKIHERKELNYILAFQKRELYSKSLLSESDAVNSTTDKELKEIYDTRIKNLKINEYKVRHILFKNTDANAEKNAKTVIAMLDTGKNFEALAKEKSQGPSAPKGGDIGWLNEAQLRNMPALAQALSEMKKGTYSKEPVKSNVGWHVLKLDDIRNSKPASFEQTKKQLKALVTQQKVRDYVANLRKNAKIEIK